MTVSDPLLKRRWGKVLHVDWSTLRRLVDESRDHVVEKSGFRLPKI